MVENVCDCGSDRLVKIDPPLCNSCYNKLYKRKEIICDGCGKIKCAHTKTLCDSCYRKTYKQPKKNCERCDNLTILKTKKLCNKCYENLNVCHLCENNKEICSREGGKPLCRNCYNKQKRIDDIRFNIICKLRQRLYSAFKYSLTGKIKKADEYGIDYSAIIQHLEPFPSDVENYNIDHIYPLVAFDFNDIYQIRAAFAPENHQWLKREENLKKGDKYDKESFDLYMNTQLIKNICPNR